MHAHVCVVLCEMFRFVFACVCVFVFLFSILGHKLEPLELLCCRSVDFCFFVSMSHPPARKRQKRAAATGAGEDAQPSVAASPMASQVALGRTAQKRTNDNLNDTNRRAVVWIWNFFNEPENADVILMCKEQLMNGTLKVSKSVDSDATNAFHATYVTFGSLPKYWIAAFLVQHVEFSAACVDQLNGNGKEGRLKHVWTFITGLDDSSHWLADVHDKVLLVKFLMFLIERLGNRHKSIVFGHDFKVDWDSVGPYVFTWGPRGDIVCVLEITHRQTGVKALVLTTSQPTS